MERKIAPSVYSLRFTSHPLLRPSEYSKHEYAKGHGRNGEPQKGDIPQPIDSNGIEFADHPTGELSARMKGDEVSGALQRRPRIYGHATPEMSVERQWNDNGLQRKMRNEKRLQRYFDRTVLGTRHIPPMQSIARTARDEVLTYPSYQIPTSGKRSHSTIHTPPYHIYPHNPSITNPSGFSLQSNTPL